MMEDNMRKSHIYIWLGHFAVLQKLTQRCKSTVIKFFKKKLHIADAFIHSRPTKSWPLLGWVLSIRYKKAVALMQRCDWQTRIWFIWGNSIHFLWNGLPQGGCHLVGLYTLYTGHIFMNVGVQQTVLLLILSAFKWPADHGWFKEWIYLLEYFLLVLCMSSK